MSWSWLWTFGRVPELPGSELLAVAQAVAAGTSNALIVDVRTEAEWRAGHVLGAKNASFLPPWAWPAAIQPLIEDAPKDAEVYVICLSAHRSIGALKWLRERGWKNVKQLKGGMKAWRAEGLPEEPAP